MRTFYTQEKHLVARFVEERERRGLSQAQVAELVGVSVTHLSRLENKHQSPGLDTALRWAHAVGLALEVVMLPENAVRMLYAKRGG